MPDEDSWPVIGQFSSIGSMGADQSKWLCSEFRQSLVTLGNSAKCLANQEVPINLVWIGFFTFVKKKQKINTAANWNVYKIFLLKKIALNALVKR